ncbi:MAG: hypothetical protein DRO76_00560 [Candidatus Altiarchaeales archaeon]|nr:MAG: hypothetical protein DRO76_00560 [Candidatus Altiarchaeales archaeon]
MEDKIVLDRETFKALAVDTRVKILKILDERQHTLTDLAEELGMAPSTIKEHLDRLVSAGLIKQIDKGRKWKYYRLTSKGKQILNPYEKKVWIILATTLVALFVSVYKLLFKLQGLVTPISWEISKAAEKATPLARGTETMDYTTTIPSEITVIATKIPYTELFVVILFVLILGICVGYLIKKKKVI